MKFNNLMHVAFFTDRMDEMMEFYRDKLGCEVKVLTRYKAYAGRTTKPERPRLRRRTPSGTYQFWFSDPDGNKMELM